MLPLLLTLLACGDPTPEPPPPPPVADDTLAVPGPPVWPQYGSKLALQEVDIPDNFGVKRVFIDPGHGAPNNTGNVGVRCQQEQVHTLWLSEYLETVLDAHPSFEANLARRGTARPSYTRRVADAAKWKADVFLSIHSDSRAEVVLHTWPDGRECLRNDTDAGFSVLWSPEGPLADSRRTLARTVARRLSDTGYTAYHGYDYGTKYDTDPRVPGVFSDNRGLLVLRRPTMTSIIIETHHAMNLQEVERWDEPRTAVAFAAAVMAGLVDGLSAPASNPAQSLPQ